MRLINSGGWFSHSTRPDGEPLAEIQDESKQGDKAAFNKTCAICQYANRGAVFLPEM
ncbi:MAG: hypothetical protein KDC61_09945 [Saprospiraceae bacterium]|nr:hypothetical protein [Saprospiraceae bacterium]